MRDKYGLFVDILKHMESTVKASNKAIILQICFSIRESYCLLLNL